MSSNENSAGGRRPRRLAGDPATPGCRLPDPRDDSRVRPLDPLHHRFRSDSRGRFPDELQTRVSPASLYIPPVKPPASGRVAHFAKLAAEKNPLAPQILIETKGLEFPATHTKQKAGAISNRDRMASFDPNSPRPRAHHEHETRDVRLVGVASDLVTHHSSLITSLLIRRTAIRTPRNSLKT
jgi:hypothetical protein